MDRSLSEGGYLCPRFSVGSKELNVRSATYRTGGFIQRGEGDPEGDHSN